MNMAGGPWPSNVGILAIEVYFPAQYVSQEKLEQHDGVGKGKYTIGLGQQAMGFCGDQEDINSLCLTATHNLLDKHSIDPNTIGRLEVGTETMLDKSKSVKTVLMQLFGDNHDIEGVDSKNACYGGTAALFNAVQWIESSAWDGRLAIVVAADIAVYAEGNARCTGGAGAIAFLLGPNAPLVFDRGLRSTCMRHTYDFYKPDMTSEYPVVDSRLSIVSYLSALDSCYQGYQQKLAKLTGKPVCTLQDLDHMVFHTPFCKLVQKSLARCAFLDYKRLSAQHDSASNDTPKFDAKFQKYANVSLETSLADPSLMREIEKVSVECSAEQFSHLTKPGLFIAQRVGNMYTPSLYASLVSLLVSLKEEDLVGKRVALFSYGSGLAASMFSLTVCPEQQLRPQFAVLMHALQSVSKLLEARREVEPQVYDAMLKVRETNCHSADYAPECGAEGMFPGTYYLTLVDSKFRRTYGRVETNGQSIANGV